MRRGRNWSRFRSSSEWNTSVGEWLVEKHGTKTRRSWRKLHIGLDADTGQIVGAALAAKEADDGAEVGPLLDKGRQRWRRGPLMAPTTKRTSSLL